MHEDARHESTPAAAADSAAAAPRKTDRREVLDALKRSTIVALLRLGASRRIAAREVQCSPATITRTAARDPDFAERLALAESLADRRALESITRAVEQERYWRAAAWVLERRNPEEFGRRAPHTYSAEQVMELVARLFRVLLPAVPAERRDEVILEFNDTLSELAPLAGQTSDQAGGAMDCLDRFDTVEGDPSPARIEELRYANWEKIERWLCSMSNEEVHAAFDAAAQRAKLHGDNPAIDNWKDFLMDELLKRCDDTPVTCPGGVVKTIAELEAEDEAARAAWEDAQHSTTSGGRKEELSSSPQVVVS